MNLPPISVCFAPLLFSWYSHIARRSSSVSVLRGVVPDRVFGAVVTGCGGDDNAVSGNAGCAVNMLGHDGAGRLICMTFE